ncbi:hypothetical protein [Paraglaciecola sp.]|uniref:hypothetical protein n=1 Tax=Paraglaciecola sp. TaxID=1920173 RepID=UPI003EF5D6C0
MGFVYALLPVIFAILSLIGASLTYTKLSSTPSDPYYVYMTVCFAIQSIFVQLMHGRYYTGILERNGLNGFASTVITINFIFTYLVIPETFDFDIYSFTIINLFLFTQLFASVVSVDNHYHGKHFMGSILPLFNSLSLILAFFLSDYLDIPINYGDFLLIVNSVIVILFLICTENSIKIYKLLFSKFLWNELKNPIEIIKDVSTQFPNNVFGLIYGAWFSNSAPNFLPDMAYSDRIVNSGSSLFTSQLIPIILRLRSAELQNKMIFNIFTILLIACNLSIIVLPFFSDLLSISDSIVMIITYLIWTLPFHVVNTIVIRLDISNEYSSRYIKGLLYFVILFSCFLISDDVESFLLIYFLASMNLFVLNLILYFGCKNFLLNFYNTKFNLVTFFALFLCGALMIFESNSSSYYYYFTVIIVFLILMRKVFEFLIYLNKLVATK